MKAGRRNKKDAVAIRRVEVARMYLQGKWQIDIAMELGVSQGQVSSDLSAIRKEWQKMRIATFEEKLQEELAKVDNLEREYWEAWNDSKKNYKRKATKQSGKTARKKPEYIEQTETEVISMGDPRFLSGIQWCINKRSELLGLNATLKLELENRMTITLDDSPVNNMPEEKAREFAKYIFNAN